MQGLWVVLCAVGLCAPAWAQDAWPRPEDALPVPTLEFDRLPPRESSEFAVQMGYGTVTFFREQVQPWVGFGFRGGWGKHFGEMSRHRVGPSLTGIAEGPVGVHTTLGLEPALAWDHISEGGFHVGAGLGPSFMWFIKTDRVGAVRDRRLVPSAAVRLGWSQTYSRVGRRLFVFVEPKCRVIDGVLNPVAVLAVGSGTGR